MVTVCGNYTYDDKNFIGRGAFGKVFKGIDKINQLAVAIKRIKIEKVNQREINILEKLKNVQHENIVTLLAHDKDPRHVYLVLEYCNSDLANYLETKGKLDEFTIRLFLIQIAKAMQVLNENHIIHRDLKPQNILLTYSIAGTGYPEPSNIQLKIADFGLARFLSQNEMAFSRCGTPTYMAPEILEHKSYNAKADLFSIGVIIFECLTNNKFACHRQSISRLTKTRNKDLELRLPNGTSAELRTLLTGLLQMDPNRRIKLNQFFTHSFLRGNTPSQSQNDMLTPRNNWETAACTIGITGIILLGAAGLYALMKPKRHKN